MVSIGRNALRAQAPPPCPVSDKRRAGVWGFFFGFEGLVSRDLSPYQDNLQGFDLLPDENISFEFSILVASLETPD
jgi:hypothetical protein